MSTGPSVVAIGGGHGLATTLRAARLYAGEVTAVVSVADDGGSSGRLRRIAGMPAPGDLRRCLDALAEEGSTWARAFEYRFTSGDLAGHALGNLVIAGLAEVTGDFVQSLELAASLLGASGRVLPATSTAVVLKADIDGGGEVLGQVNVSETRGFITEVSIVPPDAPAPPAVLAALASADQVVIGPGSLFTSVLAACVVPGIREALVAGPRGGRVYVCNLRPQTPETAGFSAADHLKAVLAHGIPVDVMVTPEHPGPTGQAVRVVEASLGLPDGTGHDPEKLAEVLRSLT
jgi:uncharacterized cofD-like protein